MSHRLAAFSTAAFMFMIDRVTKLLVESNMTTADSYTLIPGCFNLIYTENRGMVFGLMSEGEIEWRSFFLIGLTALVLAFVVAVLWQRSPTGMAASRLSRLGLSLVLGGALGNFYDRVARGSVTDFLDVYISGYHWPTFNVADSALSVGVGLILLDLWRSRRKAPVS
jgi:signal peptidase II